MDLGDFASQDTVHFLWSTNGADGASITRATNGTVSVYKANGTTQTTTGITDTEDFDSLTGIHACTIVTTNAFYATGNNYAVVLSGATIDGITVNAVLAHFSIENRSLKSVKVKTDYLPSALPGATGGLFYNGANASATDLTTTQLASVKAQVVAALNTDTYAEPGQGAPGATISLAQKLGYVYKAWRNRSTQTSTQYGLYADNATTLDQKATVQRDGTTFNKGEVGTGP
jgi:hypothetical protein